ncbi:hypothetical protein R3P38DRAFT_2555077 [Favolaschia claudopus]|uniref:Uncharacterized protein n=2 Tax=Favolaschia claudopus TaxID=2862362 RepID=A0AAW0ACE0_9AGAR
MPTVSTFRNIPFSTTYNQDYERPLLSLDWVLDSGIPCQRSVASGVLAIPCMDSAVFSTHIDISVASSLPFDLVLGRYWLQFCRDSVQDACFILSSGPVDLRRPSLSTGTTL